MLRNERGFTLVEMIAVLIILGIIFTTVAVKFGVFTSGATQQMIDQSITELNNREKLVWTNLKLSFYEGVIDDRVQEIMTEKYLDLGNGAGVSGNILTVSDTSVDVSREPATKIHPAVWSRK